MRMLLDGEKICVLHPDRKKRPPKDRIPRFEEWYRSTLQGEGIGDSRRLSDIPRKPDGNGKGNVFIHERKVSSPTANWER